MFFMEYRISLLLNQSKMLGFIYTTGVFPYIYRQIDTYVYINMSTHVISQAYTN